MNFIFYFYGIHEYFVFQTCNFGFRKPILYSVELRDRCVVIPERFELSTPGLKDRCSNHLSYEIVFYIVNGQV